MTHPNEWSGSIRLETPGSNTCLSTLILWKSCESNVEKQRANALSTSSLNHPYFIHALMRIKPVRKGRFCRDLSSYPQTHSAYDKDHESSYY